MAVPVTISLPEDLRSFVEDEVRDGAYPSTSAYLQHLIRERRTLTELHRMLDEADQSGEPVASADVWAALARRRATTAV